MLTRTVRDNLFFVQPRKTQTGALAGPTALLSDKKDYPASIMLWPGRAVAANAESRKFWDLATAKLYPLALPDGGLSLQPALSSPSVHFTRSGTVTSTFPTSA